MPNYVKGVGNKNAKLLVLGDFPTAAEDYKGEPFISEAGELLSSVFGDLNQRNWRNDFYLTYVYKYQPPFNSLKKLKEVCNPELELDALKDEIRAIRPNCILALGETALKTVTEFNKVLTYRGSILPNRDGDIKVVATIDPANLIRLSGDSGNYNEDKKVFKYIWKQIFTLDIQRAIEESKIKEFNLPVRQIRIATSSLDLYRFFQENKGRRDNLHADIETFRCTLPSCISLSFDRHTALVIPMFQSVGGIQLCTIPHSDLANIWQMLDNQFRNYYISNQNWKFDQQKLEMLGFRFKGLKSDTMLKAHTINPELPSKGQAFLTSIYTREPYYKDEGKEFVYGKHKIKHLFEYGGKDSCTNVEIDEEQEIELQELSEVYKTDLVKFYYEKVIPQHSFYFDLEKVGFDCDQGQLQFLIHKYESWKDSLQEELNAFAGRDINVNSPKQIAEFLYVNEALSPQYQRGTKGKTITVGEDALSNILRIVKASRPRRILTAILEFRRVAKTLGTYLYAKQDYDGRIRCSYRIIGTETGRSSTSILEEPTRPYECGLAFQTLTKHGDVGQDLRSIFIPRPGYVFVNIDLSQAEARVVALLSEDYELLEAFSQVDVHRRMAACALITGKLNLKPGPDKVADSIGKDSPERFIGKKSKHATNYDMKWRRFQQEVISDARRFKIDITISPYKAKLILERIHAATPKVKEVFHKEIKEIAASTRTLINPFGRVRRFFDRYSEQLFQEMYAFIPQSTVKDQMMTVGQKIKEKKFPILLCGESHDAFVFQMPKNEYIDICREIKPLYDSPISFSNCSLSRNVELHLPCDIEVGENYKEFKKVKL